MLALRTLSFVNRRRTVFSVHYNCFGQKFGNICHYRPPRLGRLLEFNEISRNKFVKCKFHTTPRRDIPPSLALLIRPLTRIGAFIFGRIFKRWWARRTPEEKQKYIKWFSTRRRKIYGALGFLFASLLTFYALHLEVDPLTKRARLILLNQDQQDALGKLTFDVHLETHKQSIVNANHPAYLRLTRITDRLLKANHDLPQVKNRQWTLTVVDSDMKNAYVLPSGNIFVFLGALQMTENDDQLAIIIAHEIAHVLLLHPIEQVSRSFILDIILALPVALVWALFPDLLAVFLQALGINIAEILLTLPYSRKLENEADDVGLFLAARACFDVRQAVVFWGLMRTLTELNVTPKDIPWLSTHPNHEDREKNLSAKLDEAINLRAQSGCPRLNAADPIKFFNALTIKEREARFKARGVL